MFRRKVPLIQTVERVVEVNVPGTERIVKEPFNSQLRKAYQELLTEHRELMAEYRLLTKTQTELLATLRSTPYFASEANGPLYTSEDEEDDIHTRRAPGPPNPFEDFREDEQALSNAFGLAGNIEYVN